MIFFFFQHLSMVLFVINLLIAVWLVGRDRVILRLRGRG